MIPAKALKCPHCQEWRKDIQRDRDMGWVWFGFGLVTVVFVTAFGWKNRWWTSWQDFFNSASGWLVVIWAFTAGAVGTFYSNRYTKVTKKQF
jgi:hypothetical protein